MSGEAKNLVSNPLPLVAVALLAAGVFVRTLPLESARPHDAAPQTPSAIGEQDVRARLWQDPFGAVQAHRKLFPVTSRGVAIDDQVDHRIAGVQEELRERLRGHGGGQYVRAR